MERAKFAPSLPVTPKNGLLFKAKQSIARDSQGSDIYVYLDSVYISIVGNSRVNDQPPIYINHRETTKVVSVVGNDTAMGLFQ